MSAFGSFIFTLLLIAAAPASHAQASTQRAYALTYIDVLPEAAPQVRELLVRYLHLSSGARGCLGAAALQELGRPERFALIEIWDSEADWRAQRSSPAVLALADQLSAFSAGYEDRRLFEARTAADGEHVDFHAPLQTIAHLDFGLPVPAEGEQFINDLSAQLRMLPGNLGAAVLRQSEHGNHLSLWVQWQEESSWRVALGSTLMHKLRTLVGPHLGSPFDERVYRSLR